VNFIWEPKQPRAARLRARHERNERNERRRAQLRRMDAWCVRYERVVGLAISAAVVILAAAAFAFWPMIAEWLRKQNPA
jgi:sterol desaturase/sphingolipid hydroxylase (fatty acid hydroxylase superfamily)